MIERVDDKAPKPILERLLFPYKYFSKNIKKVNDYNVLDAGCGNGLGSIFLSKYFKKVVKFDKDKLANDVITGDVTNLPFKSESFDMVFCLEVIEHLPAKKHLKLLMELLRVSKSAVVVGSVNKTGPFYYKHVLIYKGKFNPYHVCELSSVDWIRYAKKLKNVQVDYYSLVKKFCNGMIKLKMIDSFDEQAYSLYCVIRK